MKTFALIGAAGYIAPRHMRAIKEIGGDLAVALDPSDSVGIIDSYFPDAHFFVEFERFDRHIDKLRRDGQPVDYVSICSPNYLHDAHCRFGMRAGAEVVCEKPLVLNPRNIDALADVEQETGKRISTILQLRLHPVLQALKAKIEASKRSDYEVVLTYITSRGKWYNTSWKGDESKAGGVATNIGIHFFDMLTWLFGPVARQTLHLHEKDRAGGTIQCQKAQVRWFLSVERADLPQNLKPGQTTYRSVKVDGEDIEFSEGFTDLHTRSYEEIIAGRGFGIDVVRPSVEIAAAVRTLPVGPLDKSAHPFVIRRKG